MRSTAARPALCASLRLDAQGRLTHHKHTTGTAYPVAGLYDAAAPGCKPDVRCTVDLTPPAPAVAPDAEQPDLLAEADAAERALWCMLAGMALLLAVLCAVLWWPVEVTPERPAGWPVDAPYYSDDTL